MDNYDYLWKIARVDVEKELGRTLTEDEWTEFIAEFEGRMDNFGNELFNELIEDVQRGRMVINPDDKKNLGIGEIW